VELRSQGKRRSEALSESSPAVAHAFELFEPGLVRAAGCNQSGNLAFRERGIISGDSSRFASAQNTDDAGLLQGVDTYAITVNVASQHTA
jgi:hypothetical protein